MIHNPLRTPFRHLVRPFLIVLGAVFLCACTTAPPQTDWLKSFRSAEARRDGAEMIRSLAALAQSQPNGLRELRYIEVGSTVAAARSSPNERCKLLLALFQAGYLADGAVEPSGFWAELALLCVQHADPVTAARAIEHIQYPRALIPVLVDRRFETILSTLPRPPSISAGMSADIASERTLIRNEPDLLQPVVNLATEQLDANQFDQVLQETREAIDKIAAPGGMSLYKDLQDQYQWLLQKRADALYALSRYDEAFALLEVARQMPERGLPNISQTINLAGSYNDVGRPLDARATLQHLPAPRSS